MARTAETARDTPAASGAERMLHTGQLTQDYQTTFGFAERPFSLTPDPRRFFRTRSHARAFDRLAFALRRRERLITVSGDRGVGKSVLCRAIPEQMGHRLRTSLIPNPLLSPPDLLRLILLDFGADPPIAAQGSEAIPSRFELRRQLADSLAAQAACYAPTVVVDDAHRLPAAVVSEVLALASLERNGCALLSFVLVGEASRANDTRPALQLLEQKVTTRIRLLTQERDECAAYIEHRLAVARPAASVCFSARAVDAVFRLSGGVPRLINLLCDGALHECAQVRATRVEAAMVELAASELDLVRARPRRFRWYGRRVS